jgi:hypothetical protein
VKGRAVQPEKDRPAMATLTARRRDHPEPLAIDGLGSMLESSNGSKAARTGLGLHPWFDDCRCGDLQWVLGSPPWQSAGFRHSSGCFLFGQAFRFASLRSA